MMENKIICKVEKLSWVTAYSYRSKSTLDTVDLTLPFESMQAICRKYDLLPELGAKEASYQAFHDWLVRHRRTRKKFYGHKEGFDIESLVDLFHEDLVKTAKLENES